MPEPALRAEGLTKSYGSRRPVAALSGVDLVVQPGEVVSLIGPNGAGKTTTLHLLLGLLRPDAGSVELLGRPPTRHASRRGVGYLPEVFQPYGFLSAGRLMAFYAALSEMPRSEREPEVARQLDRLGLGQMRNRKVATLSKGMIRGLGLAQALLHSPYLLVLDEPTSSLDPEMRRRVGELIHEEKARGAAVLLSSHILSEVEKTSDRVVMMRRGRVMVDLEIASLTSPSDDWLIELSGPVEPIARAVAGLAREIVEERAGRTIVRCDSARKEALLRSAMESGVTVESVGRPARSLEDFYMECVGDSDFA